MPLEKSQLDALAELADELERVSIRLAAVVNGLKADEE